MNKKEQRRRQILLAAFNAVADKGFEQVTLQDIADYGNTSKGVTNYYFKNKESVFSHLLSWITKKIYENEKSAIDGQTEALDKLKAYINAAFASPEENKKFYRVYLEFISQANFNEDFREINYAFYENCWGLGREIVETGIEEGVFPEVDVEKAPKTIRAMIDGFLIQWIMINDDELHNFYKNGCLEAIERYLTSNNVVEVEN